MLLGREYLGKDVFSVVSFSLFLVFVGLSSAASRVDENGGGELDKRALIRQHLYNLCNKIINFPFTNHSILFISIHS